MSFAPRSSPARRGVVAALLISSGVACAPSSVVPRAAMTPGREATPDQRAMPGAAMTPGQGAAPGQGVMLAGAGEQQSAAQWRVKGAVAARAGKLEECIGAYSAALALEPDAVTAGELGLCEEALGRNLDAYEHLTLALEREVPAAPSPSPELWSRYRAGMQRLLRRLALVLVSVQPPNAEVLLDGHSFGKNVSGRLFAVLPGKHTWTARLPGRPEVSVLQTVHGGDVPDLLLALPSEATPPPRVPAEKAACEACRPAPGPPVEPCPAAGGVVMTVDLCNAFRAVLRSMDPTVGVVAGGMLSLGFTADVGPGFFLGGELAWARKEEWGFHLELDARAVLPTKGWQSPTSGRVLDVTFIDFALVPCARYKWALGCIFVDPGMIWAGGPATEGTDTSKSVRFMLGVGPRLAVDIPITARFGVRAFADLRVTTLPPVSYLFFDQGWREPPVSGFVGLGVSFK